MKSIDLNTFLNVKVAICIPCYENVLFLQRLVYSILAQDFQDYLVVITDDSTNSTIQEFISILNDKRFFYSKNIKRLGATPNCNRAIKIAMKTNPRYIKIMHHDDFFTYSHSLRYMINKLDENPQADLFFSPSYDYINKTIVKRHFTKKDKETLDSDLTILYRSNLIGAPSVTLLRNNHEIFFDEHLVWMVDVELYLRILHKNNYYCYINEPLVSIWAGEEESRMTNYCYSHKDIKIQECYYVFNKHKFLNDSFSYYWMKTYIRINILQSQDMRSIHALIDSTDDGLKGIIEDIPNFIDKMKYIFLNNSILIWGIGRRFHRCSSSLSKINNIVALGDSNVHVNDINGKNVISFDKILTINFDYILITTSLNNYLDLYDLFVNKYDIDARKILPAEALDCLPVLIANDPCFPT